MKQVHERQMSNEVVNRARMNTILQILLPIQIYRIFEAGR
jgi:hypothetical protein